MDLFPDLSKIDAPNDVPYLDSLFPSVEAPYKIAFIYDAPSHEDVKNNQHFSTGGGLVFRNILHACGFSPLAVFIGSVSPHPVLYKPEAPSSFPWNSQIGLEHRKKLADDLKNFNPNLIVPLGDVALWACGMRNESANDWHGSLYHCMDVFSIAHNFKCMATYLPSRVFKEYDLMPLMRFDLKRAREQAEFAHIDQIVRTFELNLTSYQIIDKLRNLPAEPIALDIEGYCNNISCISIATDEFNAFIIPFNTFSREEEERVLEQLRITMARVDIPKILQNCVYDYFCLAWTHRIHLANIYHDTMLSGWELYCELPKGLATQTAIYTMQPYYKYQRKVDNTMTHYAYCCTDSCVTYEIAMKHRKMLQASPDSWAHFQFNMSLLPALNYIAIRGISYDHQTAHDQWLMVKAKQDEIQLRINLAAGYAVNINSPKQLQKLLYTDLGLPKQHPKVNGRIDKTKLSTNVDSLLELNRHFQNPILRDIIAWRKCEKLMQYINVPTSPYDGRIRCSYNLVGTETGRLNCYASEEPSSVVKDNKIKSVGTNLTTITKSLRHLYRADTDYDLFQCDLSGADGWTVACRCAALGDDTMLQDYLYGIKPARVIVAMHQHGPEIARIARDELHQLSKHVGNTPDTEHLYFIGKRVQHGTNYLLGPPTMADQVLKDSYKITGTPLYVDPETCAKLQKLYLLRYRGVAAWHNKTKLQLKQHGKLTSASGHTRTFFGRRDAHETLRAAVAHEPQANTTYVTNLAWKRLWDDPENRRPNGTLIIEPLHQVHDALIGQWPIAVRDWAIKKIRTYFQNPITIAGHEITIPFEGNYGPNWKNLKSEI